MATSKKPGETWNGHVSPAVKTAYNKRTYQAITFRIKRDGSDGVTQEQIAAAAAAAGQSVNQWLIDTVKNAI